MILYNKHYTAALFDTSIAFFMMNN